jgi:nitrate reductase gamma subunit
MTTLLFAFVYISLAVSLIACVVRAIRYARLPVNLRWELYPVPHQAPSHASHGGSYFEDLDWWTKPEKSNRLGEWKATATEILFLHGMYRHNRRLWRWSYAFHLGLYLLIATGLGAVAASALDLQSVPLRLIGIPGCILVMAGSAGLFVHRITDRELRIYSTPADYFNLCFFFLTCASLLGSAMAAGVPGLRAIARALVTFDTNISVPSTQATAIALAALMIAYIPMTHMAHFIGKYFMYHAIRWGDQPAIRDRSLAVISSYLTFKPTWSAPHINGEAESSWAEIVTRNPAKEQSK